MVVDAILVPQGAEERSVCWGLKQATYPKTEVIPIPIGINNIVEHLERRKFWQTKPQTVLLMGLCGSLSARHRVGDRVLYRSCYFAGKNLATDETLTQAIWQKLFPSVTLVDSLTSDRPICQIEEKLCFAKTYPNSVVDMEGFAYLQELSRQGIAVAMLRVVSDDLTGDLPDLSRAIDDRGKLKNTNLAIAMLRQPVAATRLIRGSLIGLKSLQRVTAELFR